MPVCADTIQALDIATLPIPPAMKVLRMDVEEYTDWTGDPALRIDVLIDDDTDIKKITGAALVEFKAAIHERLIKNGIHLFPYVWHAKPSELAEEDEDNED